MNILTGGQSYKFDNEADLRKDHPSSYTATISGIKEVYNILPGLVFFLSSNNGMTSVYIAVSKHEMIRYMNLAVVDVNIGRDLSKGDLIGTVKAHRPLLFEYTTVYRTGSKYPVRFSNRTYYKQNPIDILDGLYWPYREPVLEAGIVNVNNTYEFTEQQKHEWFSYDYHVTVPYNDDYFDGFR